MLLQKTLRDQAERRPGSIAVVSGGEAVTYLELEQTGTRLAWLLNAAGCKPGDRAGLLLPKSIKALAGMLGTLQAGCIYVPMDTSSPAARLAKIVDACEPACILVDSSTARLANSVLECRGGKHEIRIGWMDSEKPAGSGFAPVFRWDDLPSAPERELPSAADPDSVAHILFTSGSTGVPKGVPITHSNVMHFIRWATRYFGTTPADRISCHPPLHFDLSTFDIWGTFLAGAQLHLVPAAAGFLPDKLAAFIRDSEITQWFSVPSALRYMAQFDVVRPNGFPSLKRLLWCGEALPASTLLYLMDRLPGVRFTNLYGPTEATIASSYYTVASRPADEQVEIPIGSPCEGETLLVLDESLQPARQGETGDLYIGGVGLSPGYWNDPQKTEAAFLAHEEYGRIYNTGDLARVGGDGLIYLIGRADSQIKTRGFRVELGEIEASLSSIELLRECAVVGVRTGGFEGTSICCAYVSAPGAQVAPVELRDRLSKLLPSYMLPSRWMEFESLPLNGNGKVNRARLKEQFLEAQSAA